jgi:UDP-glucose 4-epimerase
MTRKRAVVTGGSGRVGRSVIDCLAASHDVVNADLQPPKHGAPAGVQFIQTDVMDIDAMRRAVAGADVVIHLAGLDYDWGCRPEQFIDVNTRGSWHVLKAAEETGLQKTILCSSISICGLQEMRADWKPQNLPITEAHENRPIYPYSVSKQIIEVMGESFARKGKMEVLCIRPLAVVLPETLGDYLAFVDAPDRHWLFYYITASDLARAFGAAVDVTGLSFESFYISADDSSHPAPTLDWFGKNLGAVPAATDLDHYGANPRASVFGNAKALLGWAPTSDFNDMRKKFAAEQKTKGA